MKLLGIIIVDLGLIAHNFNSSDPEEKRECGGTTLPIHAVQYGL
jgi:hypothetical protein